MSLQLEQLTDLVRSLTERISAEEDAKELLKIQLDEAYAVSPRAHTQPLDFLQAVQSVCGAFIQTTSMCLCNSCGFSDLAALGERAT